MKPLRHTISQTYSRPPMFRLWVQDALSDILNYLELGLLLISYCSRAWLIPKEAVDAILVSNALVFKGL